MTAERPFDPLSQLGNTYQSGRRINISQHIRLGYEQLTFPSIPTFADPSTEEGITQRKKWLKSNAVKDVRTTCSGLFIQELLPYAQTLDRDPEDWDIEMIKLIANQHIPNVEITDDRITTIDSADTMLTVLMRYAMGSYDQAVDFWHEELIAPLFSKLNRTLEEEKRLAAYQFVQQTLNIEREAYPESIELIALTPTHLQKIGFETAILATYKAYGVLSQLLGRPLTETDLDTINVTTFLNHITAGDKSRAIPFIGALCDEHIEDLDPTRTRFNPAYLQLIDVNHEQTLSVQHDIFAILQTVQGISLLDIPLEEVTTGCPALPTGAPEDVRELGKALIKQFYIPMQQAA